MVFNVFVNKFLKRIAVNWTTVLLTLIFTVIFSLSSLGQKCPAPITKPIHFFCTESSKRLNDLDVTSSGTLTWYSDSNGSNSIPGSTTVVDGETYYVTNKDSDCSESTPIGIKAYEQSVQFMVNSSSCLDLGGNIFFVEEENLSMPIEVIVNNLDGLPFSEEIIWSSNIGFDKIGYYYHGDAPLDVGPHYPMVSTLGPTDPIYHIEFKPNLYDVTELNLNIDLGV